MDPEELLQKLDAERDAYVSTLQQLHEALAKTVLASTASVSSATASSSTARPALDRVSRLSMGESDRKTLGSGFIAPTMKSSFISGDDDLSDEDVALYVQELLPATTFDDHELREHLRKYEWNEESKQILTPLFTNEGRMGHGTLFPPGQMPNDPNGDEIHHSLYQFFDVGADGAPLSLPADLSTRNMTRGKAAWHIMKEINTNTTKQRQAVGRITILREPSPSVFAAVHLTMNGLFDMDEIFKHLVQQGTTSAYMARAYAEDPRKQRCFVFSFEYFTIIGGDCIPMNWQQSDQERERKASHIPISRCGSVVALSLVGNPTQKLKNSHRRAKTQYGYVFSPWSAWHVLNIQCYPDWKSSTGSHDSTKHYVNGPDAFLNTLLVEYRDAQKRFREISSRITKLVTPPPNFMFDRDLRDKLLFEDGDFTYSRRYFWAFQTLGTMNQSIKAMTDTYEDTFTKDVWEGRHKTIWPLAEDNLQRNVYWRKRMAFLKKDFEAEIEALKSIFRENEDRRKEIRNLRENLFSGTSVLESRKSVEQTEITVQQGHNIKLLTLVNMFFLPLTFVTSVFGMTNMPTDGDFWRFGVVMVTVCVPFFLLIGSMNTSVGMRFWTLQFGKSFAQLVRFFKWTKTANLMAKRGSSSKTSDVELPSKLHERTLSASDGIADRSQRLSRVASNWEQLGGDSDASPSLSKKTTISFGQPPPPSSLPKTHPNSSSHVDPSRAAISKAREDEKQIHPDPGTNIASSTSSPAQAPQLILMAPTPSYANSNTAVSDSTTAETSSERPAAPQRKRLGIWDRFWASRQRNGARDYHV